MRDDGNDRPTALAPGLGAIVMRMDLIQPFINSADAVLAQGLESPISIEKPEHGRRGVPAQRKSLPT